MRLLRLIWHATFGKIFWLLYAPKTIADPTSANDIATEVHEIDDNRYKTIKADNCTIFTNRVDNITFSVRKKMIPDVSWQFENGVVLSHSENKLLTGDIHPLSLPKKINGTVVSLLTGGGGNYNYFHWLFDVLPRLHLCESAIQSLSNVKYLVPANDLPFQRATLKHLNIDKSQQISSADVNHLLAEKVITASHPNPDFNNVPKWILSFLKNKFLDLAQPSQQSRRVYISRKDYTNKRILMNEEELISMLEPYGFETFRLSEMQFCEQISLFNNAEMVVGLHGAGLSNIAFCREKTTVIELITDSNQPRMYQSISGHLELNYTSFLLSKNSARQTPESAVLNKNDLSKLKAYIELFN